GANRRARLYSPANTPEVPKIESCSRVFSARLRVRRAAVRLIAAAVDSQRAGEHRLPVMWINQVHTAGVNPPKMAVARLKESEKAAVRTCGGIISARKGIIAPL
ncbi:MAG: hypothetical protein WA228_07100, partial [Desulfobaccales bacterium]